MCGCFVGALGSTMPGTPVAHIATRSIPVAGTSTSVFVVVCYPERRAMKTIGHAEIKKLVDGLEAVADLIHDSKGVFGLHLNGALSPWEELRTGGKYEEWLSKFDEAMKTIRTFKP